MTRDPLEPILDDPDADGPRLAHAADLADRGDPLGTLIRVQCEVDALDPDDPRRPALEAEEAELLDGPRFRPAGLRRSL